MSTITREFTKEQLQQIIETDHVQCGEASALARKALAAMDSESECLPLDYLQGHKDGLEWAAQLAEANHPETGDWLYDDPIELSKAIRKGPDMPPVQPVADSEPDRNPVLAYADSYRDMAKQGVESVPIWSVITDLERNIAPLYRHAQQAPASEPVYQYWCYTTVENSEGDPEEFWFWKDCEKDFYDRWKNAKRTLYKTPQPAPVVPVVPQDVLDALQKVARIRLDMNDFDGDRRGISDCLGDAEEALIEVVNRRAAMLHAGNSPAQSDHCPAQNCIHSAQGVDRPIAWHHTAKSKEENHSTCCFSYAPSHDFGPWYEKPQSQPHYLPEELDYDRALHFLSTEPRKATPETVIGGNSPAILGCDGAELLPSTGVVIELNPANNKLYTPLSTGISITREMIIAGKEELEACIDNGFDSDADGNRHDYTAIAFDAPYRVFCAMLAAAPQSPGSEPATVPGKWIPVSERMPENDGVYLCWDNRYVTTYAFIFGGWQANQFIAKNITHWMPLPAEPQEVK